jgi:hypothetical protein
VGSAWRGLAIEAAKIAASFRGETLTAYASRVLLDVANYDIDEFEGSIQDVPEDEGRRRGRSVEVTSVTTQLKL